MGWPREIKRLSGKIGEGEREGCDTEPEHSLWAGKELHGVILTLYC